MPISWLEKSLIQVGHPLGRVTIALLIALLAQVRLGAAMCPALEHIGMARMSQRSIRSGSSTMS
jgi:hypothetical protein